jgi:hypothetical protein
MVTPKILDSSRQSRFPQWAESARRFIRIQPPPFPFPSSSLSSPNMTWDDAGYTRKETRVGSSTADSNKLLLLLVQ